MSNNSDSNVPEPEDNKKLSWVRSNLPNFLILIAITFEAAGPLLGRVLIALGIPFGSWFITRVTSLDFIFEIISRNLGLLLIPAIVFGACCLFSLRGFRPKTYGLLEILVGLWAVNRVNLMDISAETAFGVLGGIYIMIRGLDNVAKGLHKKSRLKTLFSTLFNNPQRNNVT